MIPINLGMNQTMPPKLLILGATAEITYYLVTSYITEINKYWKWHTIHKKPHIAFAYNINRGITSDVIKLLQDNQMNYFFYDYDDMRTLDIVAGYQHIFITDIFWELNLLSSNEILYNYFTKMSILTRNSSMVHVFLPDIIFEPSESTYSVSDMANTKSEIRRIAMYKFISDLIEYYRKAEKMPVYRITYPLVFQHEEDKFISFNEQNTSLMRKFKHQSDKNIPLLKVKRSIITFKDLSEAIYLIYKNEIKNQNYNISSNTFFSEKFLCQSIMNHKTVVEESYSKIEIENSYMKDIGMKFTPDNIELQTLIKDIRNYYVK